MSNKEYFIEDLEKNVREEVREMKEELLEAQYPEDQLTEIADGWVPIYTYELLQYASNNLWLAVEEPEIYAFTGEKTPVNAIAGNIYERLSRIAREEWEKIKEA